MPDTHESHNLVCVIVDPIDSRTLISPIAEFTATMVDLTVNL